MCGNVENTTNILSDSAHPSASTQPHPHSPQINSSLRHAAKYHRTVLACCLEAWARVFRFQISERSIAASRHCRGASEHRAAAALQHASFLTLYSPTCLCCSCPVLWPDDTQHIYAEYKDPGITTANHSPSILVRARSSAAAVLRKLKRV